MIQFENELIGGYIPGFMQKESEFEKEPRFDSQLSIHSDVGTPDLQPLFQRMLTPISKRKYKMCEDLPSAQIQEKYEFYCSQFPIDAPKLPFEAVIDS